MGVAGLATEEGDDEFFVYRGEEGGVDGEDGDGAWWDEEGGAEVAVSDGGLGYEESEDLAEGYEEGGCGGPDGEDSDEGFEFFHLGYCAQVPTVISVGLFWVYHNSCFVQESTKERKMNQTVSPKIEKFLVENRSIRAIQAEQSTVRIETGTFIFF